MDRLETIISMIENCTIVTDVGTDHCYIPERLIRKGICQKVIATDLNIGPYEIACQYVFEKGLENKIEVRHGDGLSILEKDESDTIIIAGMGGLLIIRILEEGRSKIESGTNLILQPMNAEDKVRKYLLENNYCISSEKLSREGNKYYQIMKAVKQEKKAEKYEEIFLELGYRLFKDKDPLLKEFMMKKIHKNNEIINNMKKSVKSEKKLKELVLKNERIKELMREYEK